MKIVDAKREGNEITAILEDGREVALTAEYIAEHKPQLGDEYIEEVSETE